MHECTTRHRTAQQCGISIGKLARSVEASPTHSGAEKTHERGIEHTRASFGSRSAVHARRGLRADGHQEAGRVRGHSRYDPWQRGCANGTAGRCDCRALSKAGRWARNRAEVGRHWRQEVRVPYPARNLCGWRLRRCQQRRRLSERRACELRRRTEPCGCCHRVAATSGCHEPDAGRQRAPYRCSRHRRASRIEQGATQHRSNRGAR